QVTAKYRADRDDRIAYKLTSAKGQTVRLKGSVTTQGCLGSITKVKFTIATGGNARPLHVKDPALVSLLAVMMPGTVVVDAIDIGGVSLDPCDPLPLCAPSADPLPPPAT